ncbi:MAG: hypothetical protein QOF83_3555 [Solirubrobacteraceae bacterium]|nr:hypothetical protein [Solirubrobacteraceae bacterium]
MRLRRRIAPAGSGKPTTGDPPRGDPCRSADLECHLGRGGQRAWAYRWVVANVVRRPDRFFGDESCSSTRMALTRTGYVRIGSATARGFARELRPLVCRVRQESARVREANHFHYDWDDIARAVLTGSGRTIERVCIGTSSSTRAGLLAGHAALALRGALSLSGGGPLRRPAGRTLLGCPRWLPRPAGPCQQRPVRLVRAEAGAWAARRVGRARPDAVACHRVP